MYVTDAGLTRPGSRRSLNRIRSTLTLPPYICILITEYSRQREARVILKSFPRFVVSGQASGAGRNHPPVTAGGLRLSAERTPVLQFPEDGRRDPVVPIPPSSALLEITPYPFLGRMTLPCFLGERDSGHRGVA